MSISIDNLAEKTIAVIGSGNMGGALVRGFSQAVVSDPSRVIACDIDPEIGKKLAAEFGVSHSTDIADSISKADIIVIALKPSIVPLALAPLKSILESDKKNSLLISVAAGLRVAELREVVGQKIKLARAMPNIPCLVGKGMSVVYSEHESDVLVAQVLFSAVGQAIVVDSEKDLDGATGVSASGPAFVFAVIEAMADGGVKVGIPRDRAILLAAQTVMGSASLVLESGVHPGKLKDMVASPGGTTIAALHELEKGALRGTLISAVEAAAKKASGGLS